MSAAALLRLGDGGGPELTVTSPATRRPVAVVRTADQGDIAAAAARAAAAFPGWAGLDALDRGRRLRALATLIAARIDELALLEAEIVGRPIREMQAQMRRIPEWLEWFAGIAAGLEGESNRLAGGLTTLTHWEPHGVVALLTPWNHPVLILVKKLAAALAAGNTCLVKPSELAPVTPLLLQRWAVEAGIPPGVIEVVPGGPAIGEAVCRAAEVQRIDLTGGTATGRIVAAIAGERLIPVTLELGGKTPVLVFADAPLDEAVAGVLFASFVASGQTCVSASRILVERGVYPAFLERLAQRVASLRLGDPLDPTTDVGPVVRAAARDRAMAAIAVAQAEGARLAAGGRPPELPLALRDGFYVPPTLLAEVTPAMAIFREELFAPVVAVTPFADEAEALALANDSAYALGCSIWTRDVGRAHRLSQAVRAGVVWINDHHKNDPRSVWGGFGASGHGKENGWDALRSYLRKRSVVVRTAERFDDWFAGGARYG
jgi:acyl-CoA reductase-like NAD-dependent aldehyde dehydrogenase